VKRRKAIAPAPILKSNKPKKSQKKNQQSHCIKELWSQQSITNNTVILINEVIKVTKKLIITQFSDRRYILNEVNSAKERKLNNINLYTDIIIF
jgi:hypothetical protein